MINRVYIPACHALMALIGYASIKMFSVRLSRIQNASISSNKTTQVIVEARGRPTFDLDAA